MNQKIRILLIAIAVVCFAGASYYPIHYQLEKRSNESELDDLRAMRRSAMVNVDTEVPPTAWEAFAPTYEADTVPLDETTAIAQSTPQTVVEAMATAYAAQTVSENVEASAQATPAAAKDAALTPSSGDIPNATSTAHIEGRAFSEVDQAVASFGESGLPSAAPFMEELAESAPNTDEDIWQDVEKEATQKTTVSGGDSKQEQPTQTVGFTQPNLEPISTETPLIVQEEAMPIPTLEALPVAQQTAEPEQTPLPYYLKTPRMLDASNILPQYQALYAINPDLVGWLCIEELQVDYPVMQTPGDNEYYLHRDFYGASNANGQLRLDEMCDPYTPSYNQIIYGHNMKSGAMFGKLIQYQYEDFWRQHKQIEFDSLMEERTYVVVASFFGYQPEGDDPGFRYAKDFQDEAQYLEWMDQIRAIQCFDTGIDCRFGDEFVTLSTCAYHRPDGRFVVIARRIREGETF